MADRDWLPRIQSGICTGCGDCVRQCPSGALAQREGKAVLVNPNRCIYCAGCETICPVRAIELPYLVCKKRARGTSAENKSS